jgi:hypothetical protein
VTATWVEMNPPVAAVFNLNASPFAVFRVVFAAFVIEVQVF